MAHKRVKLGKGWRVSQNGEPLFYASQGYVVKSGDICERNGVYFRLSKKGLKEINARKGRTLTGVPSQYTRFGVRVQTSPHNEENIQAKTRAFKLIKKQCRDHPALKLVRGKIEVSLKSGNRYYVCLHTARVTNGNNAFVCVVSKSYDNLPIEDIALAKALTIAYGSELVHTVY